MKRREFLKTAIVAGVASAALRPFDCLGKGSLKKDAPQLVAVKGDSPVVMYERGIKELGGMEVFVKKGQTVVVKPNIGWARKPEFAANTSPDLVAAIVNDCLKAGADEVLVFDHTCNYWKSCYKLSGIEEAARKAGAKVVPGNAESDYREVEVNGKALKKAQMIRFVLDSDVFINVPVLKNHGGAVMTAAMKNLMGIVWDRKHFHSTDLDQCIADWVTARIPDLNIIDAFNMMRTHGPRGVNTDDVVNAKFQLLSKDIVAIDTAAAKILGIAPDKISYIAKGEALGLGKTDLNKIVIRRIAV
ncbi:MAG: DUF362 domain-containing protein [Lentisphaerae bacterium]|nr:DUF362 domain-containing protein [Lentisphaerota bacterium]MCP4101937.1 DUF362 domain-containing protein [Lentisphaerota bacterium]